MFYEFILPVDRDLVIGDRAYQPNQLGSLVTFYEGQPLVLAEYDIAYIGVPDSRGSLRNIGNMDAPNAVRRELYELFRPKTDKPLSILDLGDLRPGATLKDTYFGLASVLLQLRMSNVIPIIIGGGHDLTYGQYLGYQELYSLINMVVVDERVDILDPIPATDASSYLMSIFSHNPNYLFNYSHIGYQTYLNDYGAVDLLESLNFDCVRLGMIREKMEEIEPIMRDADMLSIDISAIRQADAPGHELASPNGFSGEELCQITRYAGLSDKLTSIGVYEYNPQFDKRKQTAQLIAQMLWYFIDGYYQRRGDVSFDTQSFLKFTVKFENQDHELIFWKSKVSGRWWMELPYGDKVKQARNQMVPCSYADYEMACREEIPDRWMKVYTKLADLDTK
jgi:formiminoglutamase